MKQQSHIILLVVLIALLVFGANFVSAQFFPFMESSQAGKVASEFSLATVKGLTLKVDAAFLKDKKTIVFFWATWCPHCRTALKNLQGKLEGFKQDNVQIVLVALGEKAEVVSGYLEKVKFNLDSALDIDGAVAEKYQVVGIPTFVFIDGAGIIKEVGHELPEDLSQIFGVK